MSEIAMPGYLQIMYRPVLLFVRLSERMDVTLYSSLHFICIAAGCHYCPPTIGRRIYIRTATGNAVPRSLIARFD